MASFLIILSDIRFFVAEYVTNVANQKRDSIHSLFNEATKTLDKVNISLKRLDHTLLSFQEMKKKDSRIKMIRNNCKILKKKYLHLADQIKADREAFKESIDSQLRRRLKISA